MSMLQMMMIGCRRVLEQLAEQACTLSLMLRLWRILASHKLRMPVCFFYHDRHIAVRLLTFGPVDEDDDESWSGKTTAR